MLISETSVPPCGWNSFDCFFGAVTEAQALANLELFVQKLKPAGYEYFCIDAGWYADGSMADHAALRRAGQFRPMHVDEFGRFVSSPVNFPRGLEYISKKCHESGVKFGVHMMRGIPLPALEKNTPVKGTGYRARDIYDPDNNCHWCQYWVAAKADHPGTAAFYRSEIEYLADHLEVDFIKLDDVTEHPDHVRLFAEAVDSVERPILLSLSPGNETCLENWKVFEKYANMVRITPDVWDNDQTNLLKLQRWYEFQAAGSSRCWLDLDMLPLGRLLTGLSPDVLGSSNPGERQSRMTPRGKRVMMMMMALSRSPLFFGGDLPGTPQADIDLAIHPEVLACNRRGEGGRRTSLVRHLDIRRSEDVSSPGHGWIGIFSLSPRDRHVFVTPDQLGFDRIPEMHDIWNDCTVRPDASGRIEFYLPQFDGVFLKY